MYPKIDHFIEIAEKLVEDPEISIEFVEIL